MTQKKRTEISELGEFALIDRLTGGFAATRQTTLKGAGDDAAVNTQKDKRGGNTEEMPYGPLDGVVR